MVKREEKGTDLLCVWYQKEDGEEKRESSKKKKMKIPPGRNSWKRKRKRWDGEATSWAQYRNAGDGVKGEMMGMEMEVQAWGRGQKKACRAD